MLSLTPLLVAVMFAVNRSDVNSGSAADWAGAMGTLAAVVLALCIAIGDARRRESDRKEEQAAQARLITVDSSEDAVGGFLYVTVTNHSTSPVFAVVVEAVHVTPDPLRVRFKGDRRWPRLNPGDSKLATCILFEVDGTTMTSVKAPNIVSADVSFVDSVGLRWRRWGNTPPRGGAPIDSREPPRPVAEVDGPEHN
jgi:hypothetical protein